VEEYDPATDTWTRAADLPSARMFSGVTSYGGKLYVIGGMGPDLGITNTVYVYDPVENTWSEAAPMPTARYDLEAITSNGKIYAIGDTTGAGWRRWKNMIRQRTRGARAQHADGRVGFWQ